MRLSTRLSLFFLAALAVALLGFSATLCVLTSSYLHRRADERLEMAMAMLASSAELDSDGIDWEPRGQALTGSGPWLDDNFFWTVYDNHGRLIDSSGSKIAEKLADATSREPDKLKTIHDSHGRAWRILGHRVDWQPEEASHESPDPRRIAVERLRGLRIVAGLSLSGIRTSLRNLVLTTMGLSLGLWMFAFLVGDRLSRHALRPLSEMASAAHGLGAYDLAERLPTQPGDDELAKLGQEINGLLDRLHESFERQRRFTGDASHQLRTPLTVIQGHVDLALRQDRSEEDYRKTLALVQQKTRHLRQIVDALLYLSRADTEAQSPMSESLELAEWLHNYLSKRTDRRANNVSLIQGENGPIQVQVQPVLLGELLNNLLENASKYSESGSEIIVTLNLRDGFVNLAVTDHGHGISDEDLPRIFEPFHRGRSAREGGTTGLGLGLSIASRLATSLGGTLSVESRPGHGSTFALRIPAVV